MRRERIKRLRNAIAAGIGALALGSFAGAVIVLAAAEEPQWRKQPARGIAQFVQCDQLAKDWSGIVAFYYDPDVCNAKCRKAVCQK